MKSIFKNSSYGKQLKWFCFPPADTPVASLPKQGQA